MVDATTAIAVASIASVTTVGAPLVHKLLGPTAELLGDDLRTWTERRRSNFGRIVDNAVRKLPDGAHPEGGVPPRVLARVIADGSFCEDPVAIEYLGGVMASSRSGVSRDDRGATWAALIARMSTYELRTHYIIYKACRDRAVTIPDATFAVGPDRRKYGRVFIAFRAYLDAMEFTAEEDPASILLHVLPRLDQEGLINKQWQSSEADDTFFNSFLGGRPPEGGFAAEVSLPGISLFSWAFGHSVNPLGAFVSPDANFELEPKLTLPPAVIALDFDPPAAGSPL